MEFTAETIRRFLEGAPKASSVQPGLRGWILPDGQFLCAECAGRIVARQIPLPADLKSVWDEDHVERGTVCVGCGKEVADGA